ncbi:zinc transport system ATP-binding protein [Orenia metallireducens]|uniref:Zinc transport system ATP-binding protein n=1 Tax=Orenia metallireducens TaxID=1413210 RepID=A0A285HUR7_9FIRM|nr:metal ABC transporter ATP-binding protein [Orenia metallireducens]PRX30995.1 zinc transport system ATP-binding protein [Orenia metallireducens]SNY39445.1 zinc transport system ATP-binding protein [Orenia metallireducens]
MKEIIKVKNLSFNYEDEYILKNINITINKGDFIAFIGPNGSGKSTFLKLLIGDLKTNSGEVKLLDKNIKTFKEWDKVGYISQKVRDFNSSFPATVKEIVGAALYQEMGWFKILTKRLEQRIDKVLKLVDMSDYKYRKIGELSGGQQQRVFIARTLITNPEIIFLDEPLVGVDLKSQDEFYNLLTKLNRDLGITIVMISHDIYMISDQANKIFCFGNKSIFVHQAKEFDYVNYLNQIKGDNKSLIPKHEHQRRDNRCC